MAGRGRAWIRDHLGVTVLVGVMVVGGLLAAGLFVAVRRSGGDWGDPSERVTSPTGEYEVVTYEWSAMIDPGWNLAIQRVDGADGEREWFWRSTEMPAPKDIRFTGPTTVEVADDLGQVWVMEFDPDTLEPSERYCPSTSYCTDAPWNEYTATTP